MQKKIIATFAAGMIIIAAHYAGATSFVESIIARVLTPIQRTVFGVGEELETLYATEESTEDYKALAERFRQENERLLAENVGLQLLKEENRSLRQQLDFYAERSVNKKLVNIIGRGNPLSNRKIITIDAGTDHGVRAGLPVVADNGLLVGKIFDAEERIAHVYVLTDELSQVAAAVSGRMETEGLVVGENGLAARLTLVPQDQALELGEVIITSGLEPDVPAGLIIGTVQEIEREPNDVFQSAIIAPAARLSELSVLSVVIP